MKTRLLKKIRKRFVIYYYPDGYVTKYHDLQGMYYQVIDKKYEDSIFQRRKRVVVIPGEQNISNNIYRSHEDALNACKNWIVNQVREEYYKYSVKPKNVLSKKQKVWYNP